jgi:hypothetical protein
MKKRLSFLVFVFTLMFSLSLIAVSLDATPPQRLKDGTSGTLSALNVGKESKKHGDRQTVIDSVPAPGTKHMGLGWDGTYLYNVSNEFLPIVVYKIDPVSGITIDTITTQINSAVLGCTYLNGSLWIQEFYIVGNTYEVDPTTGNTISSFLSPATVNSRGLTNDGTYLWIMGTGGNFNMGTAYQVTTTGVTNRTVDISIDIDWPIDAAWNSYRGTLFLTVDNTFDIRELDVSGGTSILLDSFSHPDPSGIIEGITYDGHYLWTCSFYGAWIWQIDIGDPCVAEQKKPDVKTPHVFDLQQNTPNPFRNGKTAISYTTPGNGSVKLSIYDNAGRLVRTLIDRTNEGAGHKTIYWDGMDNNNRSVAAGVYFYKLSAENKTATKKMVVVK